MLPQLFSNDAKTQYQNRRSWMIMALVLVALMTLPAVALAQPSQITGANGSVCSFFGSANQLLGYVSVTVVTIAVVFSGYQIAFAHKRIAEVAPVLIGGVLIGAAAQVATWVLPQNQTGCTASIVQHFLNHYA
jgi:type IV secretion system protein VirB2